tara:strand:- start:1370 stop:2533 length:1164 start_codon:yes stop_codon:yes gene_type:complete
MKSMQLHYKQFVILVFVFVIQACGNGLKSSSSSASVEDKLAAIKTLRDTIKPVNVTVTTSTEIDWPVGILPWDKFTLPVFSPNGLHAAVQLGKSPSVQILCGNANTEVDTTTLEIHLLDPLEGKRFSPIHIGRKGLILSRSANSLFSLVESPNGTNGRWIGKVEWSTGNINWVASDEYINAFPTINSIDEIAWSRRGLDENRFHLVLKTARGQRVIDDGKSDWLMPMFLGIDRLRVFRIQDGSLILTELDLNARDPLLTALSLPIIESGATRELVWQIATTNTTASWHESLAFYHPIKRRMVVWQPTNAIETVSLLQESVAATPASDGSWLVATGNRIIRQTLGEEDGVHIRNRLAIPIATTSNQWTHYMLIPEGNRLQIRAINLDD